MATLPTQLEYTDYYPNFQCIIPSRLTLAIEKKTHTHPNLRGAGAIHKEFGPANFMFIVFHPYLVGNGPQPK